MVSNDEILRFHDYVAHGEFDTNVMMFGSLFVLYSIIYPAANEPDVRKWVDGAHMFINREAMRLSMDITVVPDEFSNPSGLPS